MGRQWQQVVYAAEVMKHYPSSAKDRKSQTRKLVLLAVATFADNSTGKCYPSAAAAAQMAGVSKSTFWKHIDALAAEGVLLRTKRGVSGKGLQLPNEYRIVLPALLRLSGADEAVAAAEAIAEREAQALAAESHAYATTVSDIDATRNSKGFSQENSKDRATTAFDSVSVCGTVTSTAGFTIGGGFDGFFAALPRGKRSEAKDYYDAVIGQGHATPAQLMAAAQNYAAKTPERYRCSAKTFLKEYRFQEWATCEAPKRQARKGKHTCSVCEGVGFVEVSLQGAGSVSVGCETCGGTGRR